MTKLESLTRIGAVIEHTGFQSTFLFVSKNLELNGEPITGDCKQSQCVCSESGAHTVYVQAGGRRHMKAHAGTCRHMQIQTHADTGDFKADGGQR